MVDVERARRFLATHGRVLDRRRFDLALGTGSAAAALAALEAYGNEDGGYGAGLEPDLRSVTSQPVAAMHAFEVFEEVAPSTSPRATRLCDWLESVTLDDGGLPFALPVPDPAGCAPFWAQADATTSSLHITCAVAAVAHRVAEHDQAVRDHPWLARATDFCLDRIQRMHEPGHALELMYALQFLDAASHLEHRFRIELHRLGMFLPPTGRMHVEGGLEDETLGPLDFSPWPDDGLRALFSDQAVREELDALADSQEDDGGWTVGFASYSPAAALEWRGYRTVAAIKILRDHGRLPG